MNKSTLIFVVSFFLLLISCVVNNKDSKDNIRFDSITNDRTKKLTNNKWLLYSYINKELDTEITLNKNFDDSLIVEFNTNGNIYINRKENAGSWKTSYFLHSDKKHITSNVKLSINDKIIRGYIPDSYFRFEYYGEGIQILRLKLSTNNKELKHNCIITLHKIQ